MEGLSMKKGILAFVLLILVSACVQPSMTGSDDKEVDIVKELQEIEAQLGDNDTDDATGAVVVEVVDADDAESDDTITVEEIEDADVEDVVADVEEALKNKDIDTSKLQRIEVSETELVDLKIDAKDDDLDTVTFEFSAPLDDDGAWQTDYGDAGEYVVTVTASDGTNTVERNILLAVKKKNVPPAVGGVEDLVVNEGDLVSLQPEISDKNDDEVALTYSKPLDETGEWQTDHKSSGSYDVTLTASDGEADTVVKFKLSVRDVNVPPELSGFEEHIEIDEGEKITLKPVVSDLDGDKVDVSISDPVGDDGLWETTFTDNGEYTVTVAASDGKDTVNKEISIVVNDVNVPPEIIGISKG